MKAKVRKKTAKKAAAKKTKVVKKKTASSARTSAASSAKKKEISTRGVHKKTKKGNYKVGDYLVYPMHGVGQITSVSRQKILGKAKSCYVMDVENSKMTVMVPVENAEQIGIRPIIAKREIRKVISLLKKDEVDTEEDWKIRYQNNMNKIKSGSIYSVAEVCRNLYKRAQDRELSLMERRLYESAYRLISSEIALSNKVSFEEAGNMISEVLA